MKGAGGGAGWDLGLPVRAVASTVGMGVEPNRQLPHFLDCSTEYGVLIVMSRPQNLDRVGYRLSQRRERAASRSSGPRPLRTLVALSGGGVGYMRMQQMRVSCRAYGCCVLFFCAACIPFVLLSPPLISHCHISHLSGDPYR